MLIVRVPNGRPKGLVKAAPKFDYVDLTQLKPFYRALTYIKFPTFGRKSTLKFEC